MRRKEGMSGREEKGISTVTNLWNADNRGREMERSTAKERDGKDRGSFNITGMTAMIFWQQWKHWGREAKQGWQ